MGAKPQLAIERTWNISTQRDLLVKVSDGKLRLREMMRLA